MPTDDKNKQPNILELFKDMLDDHLGKKEFTDAFQKVIQFVKDADAKTAQNIEALSAALTAMAEELKTTTAADFTNHKTEAQSLLSQLQAAVDEKLQAVDNRLDTLKDGKDADPEYVISEVLTRIQLPEQKEILLDTPEDIRNKLEVLQDGEKLAIEAIDGLRKELDELKKKANTPILAGGPHYLAGSGISIEGNVLSATGGGGGVSFETPTGTVDGSNTSFTVTETPVYVIVDGVTYFEDNGYTISGSTITTSVPPTGFIRSAY